MELARENNGVIINADSMQIYDALPMLSAQPSEDDKEEIPHRLYGFLKPSESCSAQKWADMALHEIEQAHEIGYLPIVVGGTGFYIKSLMNGLSPIPDVPEYVRRTATELQESMGNPTFHDELAKRDPVMAERLHPNDTQRTIRAWEVLEHTGKSLSYWQAQPPKSKSAHLEFAVDILNPEREILYERCNKRFDIMIENDVVDEVRDLDSMIEKGAVPEDAAITNALGFHPLQAYLHGQMKLDEAIEASKTETRQYAKRQTTWFKNQMGEYFS
jgi:tRNA dimethylallyltransferase